MELTRKVILQSIYDLDYTPKITPTRPLFRKFAEDFVLKHYGVCETDLASAATFKGNVKNLDIRTGKRMGSSHDFPGFLGADVHQKWLEGEPHVLPLCLLARDLPSLADTGPCD